MSTPTAVGDGTVVTIHYTLSNDAGQILDTSEGMEPMAYLHGADNIVTGLEKALDGKAVGDDLKVAVPPEEGYGLSSGADPFTVERGAFPDGVELESGMQFGAEDEQGNMRPVWIVHVDDEGVHLTLDHPLAGETLHFEVKVVELRAATAEEVAHGHPHGPGGHHH
jgi:FKBP-type peptidyl-prolyl cis-trans isomerase SlyD